MQFFLIITPWKHSAVPRDGNLYKAPRSVQRSATEEIQKQSTKHLKVSLKNLMDDS